MDAGYENLCEIATPANVMVVGFTKPELKRFEGKRLAEIAAALNKNWAEVIIDLNVEENLGLGELLFLMSEENMRLQLRQPWMKFGTDASSQDPATAQRHDPPARVRQLPAPVRTLRARAARDPARGRGAQGELGRRHATLAHRPRACSRSGLKADIIIFDETTITDNATFDKPHQLSTGVRDMFVNGVAVLRDGQHTGAKPGQVVRGPGYRPRN
jgi:N-acyl-D-amino-acid deacylase